MTRESRDSSDNPTTRRPCMFSGEDVGLALRLTLCDVKWKQNRLYYMATVRPREPGRRRKPLLLCPWMQKLRTRDSRNRPSLPRPVASQHIAQHPDQNLSFQLCTCPVKSELLGQRFG